MARYILAALILFAAGGCSSIIEDFTQVTGTVTGTDTTPDTAGDAGNTDSAASADASVSE